jgi:hypothetical protein
VTTHKTSRGDQLLIAAAGAVVCAAGLLIVGFGHGRDQSIYSVVARTLLDGGMPYRDAWDFKPPAIYLLYAASRALFGDAAWGIRVIEALGLWLTVAAMSSLAQRFWGEWRIGMLAGALAALLHAQLDFWHTAQPETFGGMLTVAALAAGADARASRWRLALAGALLGFAGMLKPPLAGGGVVLAAWLGWMRHRANESRAHAAAPLAWIALGGVACAAAFVAWFAWRGALGEMLDTMLRFTPHYTALSWDGASLAGLLFEATTQWLLHYGGAMSAGLALAALQWRSLRAQTGAGLLLGIALVQLVGVALQGKLFAYHYGALWPVTAMLAGYGWWRAWRWARHRGAVHGALVALALIVSASLRTATKDLPQSFWRRCIERARIALMARDDQGAIDALATVADVDAAANRALAVELRERTTDDDVIYVWGFEPALYDLSGRRAASRYIYNVPQRVAWSADDARATLLRELTARPPAALVVVEADAMPDVTGNIDSSRQVLAFHFPELATFIHDNYGMVKRSGDFELWLPR